MTTQYMYGSDYEVSYASSKDAPSDTPHPWPDRRRRRFMHTKRIDASQTFEGLEFINEDYRLGYPHLCADPVDRYPIWPESVQFQDLGGHRDIYRMKKKIKELLQTDNVDCVSVDFLLCRQTITFNADRHLTAVVIAKRAQLEDYDWLRVAKGIVDFLRSKNLHTVALEILDPGSQYPPWVEPLSEEQIGFVEVYGIPETIRAEFNCARVERLVCCRVETPDGLKKEPTILVVLEPDTNEFDRDFMGLRDRMVEILETFFLDDFAIKIIRNSMWLHLRNRESLGDCTN